MVTEGPLFTWAMIAFIEYARSCPPTIMNWSTATSTPRIRFGAVSPRKTGTVAEAPPTAKPRTMRNRYSIQMFTEKVQPSAPRRNTMASSVML